MRLALDPELSPQQMGALRYRLEQRLFLLPHDDARRFTKVMTDKGVNITPLPQDYYLAVINKLSDGQCAGFIHLLSLAVAEGKQDTFLSNVYNALADPDAPESQVFFHKLAYVQSRVTDAWVAHDPATRKEIAYTEIAPQLYSSPTTKTLLISADEHRLSAGVIVDDTGGRTYYYNDPNIGLTVFFSREAFEKGLKRIFTSPELKDFHDPFNRDIKNPKYLVSVFDPQRLPALSGDSSGIRFMYDAPLGGLDKLKVIDATHVPTKDAFAHQTPAPAAHAKADYEQVIAGLGKLHDAKGMSKFHHAKGALKSVQNFLKHHPDSPLLSPMRELERTLINALNAAGTPVGYPYAFERIEQQRASLAEAQMGKSFNLHTKAVEDTQFHIVSPAGSDPKRSEQVARSVEAALQRIQLQTPKHALAVAGDIDVIVARPGDQPETKMLFSRPPTLIIGDDFFAPVDSSNTTVADRVGHRAEGNGLDGVAKKQAALIAGKLGMLGYYKADAKGFLEVISNKEPFRPAGSQHSARAGRSSRDFMEETFTSRLHEGKLDKQTSTALDTLFPGAKGIAPAPITQPPGKVVTPSTEPARVAPAPIAKVTPHNPSASLDPAVVARLRTLDASQPPIRFGEVDVSRVELYRMGVSIDGQPIESPLPDDPTGSKMVAAMQVDYLRLEAYLKSESSDAGARAGDVLAEFASLREPGTPLVSRRDGKSIPEALQKSLSDMSQHSAAIRDLQRRNKPLPAGFFSSSTTDGAGKSNPAGLGFQAFSSFQGIRSSIDSIQRGDTTAGVIGLGAVGADYVGMGVEVALNKVAHKAVSNAAPTILKFQSATVGKMIGKMGGGVGLGVSIPFDVYNAVDSFKKAGRSSGKDAQDHYVNGAFAVANAATSIALGAAFLSGVAGAGPAGLVIAGGLMVAQSIYSAVRTVEDINKYTPLTGKQKFTLGLKSFLGFPPGYEVMKPYLQAKYAKAHEDQSRAQYKAFLEGPGKDHYERVVFGATDVEITQVPGKVPLMPALWWNLPSLLLSLIKVDGKVPSANLRGGNDHIRAPEDTWNGMSIKPVEGVQGGERGTLWMLGDGDDVVTGVMKKHNYFSFGGGKKLISGGDADDTFNFNADARQTLEQMRQVADTEKNGFSPKASEIWGGDGTNTLSFSGELNTAYSVAGETQRAAYSGHVINFKTGAVSVNTPDSKTNGVTTIAYFHSFSNAVTVENGESFIQGDDQDNHLILNGNKDVVLTGKGANVIVVNGGANIVGQGGFNTYEINKGHQAVIINDPVDSVIKLDYSAAQIYDWGVTPEGDLVATLNGDNPGERRSLIIKNAYPKDSTEDTAKPKFITNDGTMITINAPRKPGSTSRVVQVNSLKVESPKV
ncbi:calcium-binding protein [Pseudomonas sp. D2002]|nr:calcium-binding protein [Pseudomonas sp. D2002]